MNPPRWSAHRLHGALLLTAIMLPLRSASAATEAHPWLHVTSPLTAAEQLPPQTRTLSGDREGNLVKAGFGHVELLSREEVHLDNDGVIHSRITIVRRFLSASGVDSGANMAMLVNPSDETVTISAAYVHTADGRMVAADPTTIQVVDYSQPSLFSDAKVVVVPCRDVGPGATAVFVSETQFRSREWPLPWSMIMPLQGSVPIEALEVTVEWDEHVPPPVWKTDDPGLSCRTDGARRLRCSRTGSDAFPIDPQLSSGFDFMPQLVIAQNHTWSELANIVADVIEKQIGNAPEVTTWAHKLAAGRAPHEALAAFQRFVANDVRYVGLEHGEARVVPHPPQLTLERRFGDCKDKVTLFLALARAAGLPAHAVLAATNRYRLDKLITPSLAYFNHMVACVDEPAGQPACVDLTVPGAAIGELPPTIEGAVALDLMAGTAAPRLLPASQFAWRVEINVKNTVHCDGSIHEQSERRVTGPGAMLMRKGLSDLTVENRTRWAEEEYHRVLRRDLTPTVTFGGLSDPVAPLTIAMQTDYPATQPLAEKQSFADWDAWLIDAVRGAHSQNRHHPYRYHGLRVVSGIEYDVCPDVEIYATGAELDLHSRFGSLTRKYDRTAAHVRVDTTLEVPRIEVAGADIESFNRFITQALEQSRIWLGLRHKGQ